MERMSTDLFWSEQGEVACATHAPYPKSDTWNWGRWTKMTVSDRIEFAKATGRPSACECCESRKRVAVAS